MSRVWKNARLGDLSQSYIRHMTRECERVGGINMGQGVCDLPTPPEILQAASEAVLADESTYSPYEGAAALRQVLAEKTASYNGLTALDPNRHIVVSVGATGAFECTVQALLNPGDQVIVFEPYYGYHIRTLQVAGLSVAPVRLKPDDWALDGRELERAVTTRTRAILINTPANPSGKVFSRHDLELVAELCMSHDLLAITDEIYEYMVYDVEHISLAALPGMWDRTVTISGASKTFSITGWRIGYAVAQEALSERIGVVNDLLYICAPTPLQLGLARGVRTLSATYYSDLASDYRRKRDRVCNALRAAGFGVSCPQGAYYILAEAGHLGCESDVDAAFDLLERTGIASVPGRAFFATPPEQQFLRFCYAKDWPTLEQACERLSRG